jgi:hypothetical protein
MDVGTSAAATLRRSPHLQVLIAAVAFGVSLTFFVAFEWGIVRRLGFRTDELFSLWAADPTQPFLRVVRERILPDINPPLYYLLLYGAQRVVGYGRAAMLWVNGLGLLSFLVLLLWIGYRRGMLAFALLVGAFFLLTAPALSYAPEGRTYAWSMSAVLNVAFLAATCVTRGPVKRVDISLAVLLTVICSWLHVYAAIFCGSLGAALILVGHYATRRDDLVRLGFAIGISAVAAFALWFTVAQPVIATIGWNRFTPARVFSSLWTIKQYSVGWKSMAALGGVFVGASLLRPVTRPMALVLVITGVLVFLIPFFVSFRVPILFDMYFMVGIPALLALMIFVLRSHILAALENHEPRYHRTLAAVGAVLLLAALVTGWTTASWHFQVRWDWRGVDVVEPLSKVCQERRIRVLHSAGWQMGFPYLLRGFDYVDATTAPVRDISEIDCPIYGWAEHYLSKGDGAWVDRATVAEALSEFRLTNVQGLPLAIERHPGGLVLYRARP